MSLLQKADYLRRKMIPYVPDKLQGISAVAVSRGSMVSITDGDLYSLSSQSAFQTLSEGSMCRCLSTVRNCKARENPTQLSCVGSANQTGVSGRGVAAVLQWLGRSASTSTNASVSSNVELNCKNQFILHRALAQEFSEREPVCFNKMCWRCRSGSC